MLPVATLRLCQRSVWKRIAANRDLSSRRCAAVPRMCRHRERGRVLLRCAVGKSFRAWTAGASTLYRDRMRQSALAWCLWMAGCVATESQVVARVDFGLGCGYEASCEQLVQSTIEQHQRCVAAGGQCDAQADDIRRAKLLLEQVRASEAERRASNERDAAATRAAQQCLSNWSLDECDKTPVRDDCRKECQRQLTPNDAQINRSAAVCKARTDSTLPEPLKCELMRPALLTDAGWERYQSDCNAACAQAWEATAGLRKERATRIAESLKTEEERQRRKLDAERAEREEEKRQRQMREAEAAARQRGGAPPTATTPPANQCGDHVQCCDGTCSPSCRDVHRGCCSRHGGVCN